MRGIVESEVGCKASHLRIDEETGHGEHYVQLLVCRGYSVDVGGVDIFETDAEGKRKKEEGQL